MILNGNHRVKKILTLYIHGGERGEKRREEGLTAQRETKGNRRQRQRGRAFLYFRHEKIDKKTGEQPRPRTQSTPTPSTDEKPVQSPFEWGNPKTKGGGNTKNTQRRENPKNARQPLIFNKDENATNAKNTKTRRRKVIANDCQNKQTSNLMFSYFVHMFSEVSLSCKETRKGGGFW